SALIATEGFAVKDGHSRGVLLRGIDPLAHQKVSGLELPLDGGEIILGSELAKDLDAQVGEKIVVVLGSGQQGLASTPKLRSFSTSVLVQHGIYEKDLRFAYVLKSDLEGILGFRDKINTVLLALNPADQPVAWQLLEDKLAYLKSSLSYGYH